MVRVLAEVLVVVLVVVLAERLLRERRGACLSHKTRQVSRGKMPCTNTSTPYGTANPVASVGGLGKAAKWVRCIKADFYNFGACALVPFLLPLLSGVLRPVHRNVHTNIISMPLWPSLPRPPCRAVFYGLANMADAYIGECTAG